LCTKTACAEACAYTQKGENANALDATRCTALALWLGSG
jgi:hypothetical protein